jgi:1-phosphofructokinase family hexose kinase
MILTVTLNPLLERRYSFPQINFGKENRNGDGSLKAGGKGINVCRQLNKLDIQNVALTFTGGANGKLFKDILRNEGISFSDVQIEDEIRDAAIILDESSKTISTFFSKNFSVTKQEKESFTAKMEKMISNCEMVIFCGSSPCKVTDPVFAEGIEIANKFDKISICDTYGEHLKDYIDASPTILHNNIDEVETSLQSKLKNESDKLSQLDHLYSKGIKQAFLTDGGNPFYISNFDFHYKVPVPAVEVFDANGSGDAFVAGIAYGWHNRLTFEEQVKFAAALGVCNAKTLNTCNVEKKEAEEFEKLINLEPVGKKVKVINDSPD